MEIKLFDTYKNSNCKINVDSSEISLQRAVDFFKIKTISLDTCLNIFSCENILCTEEVFASEEFISNLEETNTLSFDTTLLAVTYSIKYFVFPE